MSTPPKFFGLIWAFFVEEAVWDLFLEGSEAKFATWAVWQVRFSLIMSEITPCRTHSS